MTTVSRGIAVALSTVLLATTAIAPMASARDRHGHPQRHAHSQHRGGDNTGALIGLGIVALAGAAIIASAAQPPQPVYAPPPAYPPQPSYWPRTSYVQPIYDPQAFGQSAPTCTTINGYAACLGPDGTWHYVR